MRKTWEEKVGSWKRQYEGEKEMHSEAFRRRQKRLGKRRIKM